MLEALTAVSRVVGICNDLTFIYKKITTTETDSLELIADTDLVALRDKMVLLQDMLNRDFPQPSEALPQTTSFKSKELTEFINTEGVTDIAKELAEKISEIVADAKDVMPLLDEAKDWDSISDVFRNVEKIGEIIFEVVQAGLLAKELLSAAGSLATCTNEEIAEASATFLDDAFKLSPIVEVFDKAVFKALSYVVTVAVRAVLKRKNSSTAQKLIALQQNETGEETA